MPFLRPELLGHKGDDVRLADGLTAGDRQGVIGVSTVDEFGRDKVLARHVVHSAQHRLVADTAATQRQLKPHPLHVVRIDPGHGDLAEESCPFFTIMSQHLTSSPQGSPPEPAVELPH